MAQLLSDCLISSVNGKKIPRSDCLFSGSQIAHFRNVVQGMGWSYSVVITLSQTANLTWVCGLVP